MKESEIELQGAVESLHACSAAFREVVPVKEMFKEEVAWEGLVHVFDLTGHAQADKCYAWSSPIGGSSKQKFYAVLHTPSVDSPEKAVRASIIQDHRSK